VNRKHSLRRTITLVIVLLTTVAMLGVVALVVLTGALHRVSRSLSDAVESVRATENAESSLLLHDRAAAFGQATFEAEVRRDLTRAGQYIETAEEQAALERALRAVDAYFESGGDRERELLRAFTAVDELVQINMAQAAEAMRAARAMDRLANLIAVVCGAAFILSALAMVWWLYRRAFAPTLSLGRAMERFSEGDREVRAVESGPDELAHMAVRFNQMAAALERQQHREAAFLAGVAHDLRNPLATLRFATGVVRPGKPLPPERRIRTVFERLDRQVDRLERMITDFLDTARIRAGELELSLERFDLRELARPAVELFEATTELHELEVEVAGEPVWVQCDPYRMEQVANNLVSNAIKYSPQGGKVSIAVAQDGADAVLSVRDPGIGIAREAQGELFEPFRRVKLTGQELPGVGLGLFVARRIVDAHAGRIEIDSAPGRGSTFRVRLPLAAG
jgi:two-component system, OmpR family, sensor histidine kinase MtrB